MMLNMAMCETGFKVQHAVGAKHAVDLKCSASTRVPSLCCLGFGVQRSWTLSCLYLSQNTFVDSVVSVSACVSSQPSDTSMDLKIEISDRERNSDAVFLPFVLMSPAQPQGGDKEPCHVFKGGCASVQVELHASFIIQIIFCVL